MVLSPWMRGALTVFGVSMLPVFEVKAAIPLGLSMGLPFMQTFLIALFGSILPSPFILLLLRPFFKWCRGKPFFKTLADKLEARFQKKARSVYKYQLLGLFLFVAIPLPGTGVWTGSGIAAMMDIRIRRALPIILLGNFVASSLMLLLGQIVIG